MTSSDTTPQGGHKFIEPCGSQEGQDACWYDGKSKTDVIHADPRAGADPGRYSKEWWMERARREPDGAMDVGGADASGAVCPTLNICCDLAVENARLQAEVEQHAGVGRALLRENIMVHAAIDAANERARLIESQIRDIHTIDADSALFCNGCGFGWPCRTIRVLDAPVESTSGGD